MMDQIPYLIGQLLGIVAVVLGFLSFQRKTAAGIVLTQMAAALVFVLHYTLLSAPTAIALNDPQRTRQMMLVKTPLCFLYNLMVGSVGGMIYECTVLTSSIIGIIRYRKKGKE